MNQEITKGEGKSLYDFMKEQNSDFDVYDGVMDIDEMLARQEREAYGEAEE